MIALYEDGEFAPKGPIMGKKDGVVWRRPRDLLPEPRMVNQGFDTPDVTSRGGGGQFSAFFSACSAIAANLQLMEHVVVDKAVKLDGDGYTGGPYRFKFFVNGEWRTVSIDDRIPVVADAETGCLKPVYSVKSDWGEVWVELLMKAYAKLHGSYDRISGDSLNVFTQLTGGSLQHFSDTSSSTDIWKLVGDIMQNPWHQCHVTAQTKAEFNSLDGIEGGGRSYAILACIPVWTLRGTKRLFRVRDPALNTHYTGDWCKGSPAWRLVEPQVVDALTGLALEPDKDGQVYICQGRTYRGGNYNSFYVQEAHMPRYFASLDMCCLQPEFLQQGTVHTKEKFIQENTKANVMVESDEEQTLIVYIIPCGKKSGEDGSMPAVNLTTLTPRLEEGRTPPDQLNCSIATSEFIGGVHVKPMHVRPQSSYVLRVNAKQPVVVRIVAQDDFKVDSINEDDMKQIEKMYRP